jgi:GT2 family glycosyltransferase
MPALDDLTFPVSVLLGTPGSATQRNRGLAVVEDSCDYVVFLDDDFVPGAGYIESIILAFEGRLSPVAVGGHVIADGARGAGYTIGEARRMLEQFEADAQKPRGVVIRSDNDLYGCNMSFSLRAIKGLRFDDRLVLYGWLEDRDFANRVARMGAVARSFEAVGVHLGVKQSRASGRRMGYSQIINPVYLYRKGTITLANCLGLASRGLMSNALRYIKPEPYLDRRGRMAGNLLALGDLFRGRIEPERVIELN